jgi:hypothetical protein
MTWAPCASGAMVNHFQAKFIKQKLLPAFPIVNLVSSWPPRPGPDPKPGVRGPKQGLECIYSLNCATRRILYKTKVVGQSCFSWGGSCFWTRNLDLEGPGPLLLLEPWSIIFKQSLLNKDVVHWGSPTLPPCHLCPHNTLYYFNIMTRAMPGRPS